MLWLCGIAVVSLTLSSGAIAQIAPNVEQGRELAESLCSSCHIVGKTATGVVKADVPSFTSIANLPDQSADRLKARLIVPHQPMPDL